MNLPETYILGKFYTYTGEPEFRKHDNVYNAGCPVCHEGKSWGKKKRLYYYPSTNSLFCFNCNRSWNALGWITEACGLSREEVQAEVLENKTTFDITNKISPKKNLKKSLPDLPYDSVNLNDEVQRNFYKNNKFFQKAVEYAESRRLFTATNRSKNLYISLTDFYHKNRLCIPFQDRNNKILFYQTRALDESNPKYLGKMGYDKTLFGIDKIDDELDYLFIFEGPIDAMFVKNGLAAAGLNLTSIQSNQLMQFPLHKKIWVLDNPRYDKTAKIKIQDMVNKGYNIFRWPLHLEYKDFNEMAVKQNKDEIDYNLIISNLY